MNETIENIKKILDTSFLTDEDKIKYIKKALGMYAEDDTKDSIRYTRYCNERDYGRC